MTGPYVIEALAKHDRRNFTCGVTALDRYFREQASQDIRPRVTNCFVAIDRAGDVAGYNTVAAASLPLAELTGDAAKRLPRYSLLPAALIGRLAVAEPRRGQGLGAALIVDAVARTKRAEPAIFALIVDAKDAQAVAF